MATNNRIQAWFKLFEWGLNWMVAGAKGLRGLVAAASRGG